MLPRGRTSRWRGAGLAIVAAWSVVAATLPAGDGGELIQPRATPRDPTVAEQRRLCASPRAPAALREHRRRGLILWTDAPLDADDLLGHLQDVAGHLEARLPTTRPAAAAPRHPQAPASRPAPAAKTHPATRPARRPPARPVAIAVYAKAADYRRLWRRVGEYYNGRFGEITTEGYSYRVFCATSYDGPEEFRRRRSVLCHELAHVWLYQRHGLRNDGNWLTEGIATAVQLRFFPESGSRADFARWLATGRMLPLKRLMDLPRIAPKDYWQAATLVELLMREHSAKLPAVVAAFNEGRSAYAIVTRVLGTDLPTLSRRWAEHVRLSAGLR